MTDELRAKFEAWVSKNTNWSLSRSANESDDDWGPYIHERTACAWLGYQEAHASRDAEVEALKRRVEQAELLLRKAQNVIDDYTSDHPRDAAYEVSLDITRHLITPCTSF